MPDAVDLRDVGEVAGAADRMVEQFRHAYSPLLPGAEIHHIDATAMPFGHTKGDVDLNIRVAALDFADVLEVLRRTCRVAQPENWTETFASDAALLRRYDDCNLRAAPDGTDVYWRAKDAFLGAVILSLSDR